MEDLKKRNEELSSEVALLKEQFARMNGTVALMKEQIVKMTETLRSLERKNLEESSTEGQASGPALAMALSSQAVQNLAGLFPCRSLSKNDQPVMAQLNPTQALEIPVSTTTILQPSVTVAPSNQPYYPRSYQPPYQPPINPYPYKTTTIQTPHQQMIFRPPPLLPTPQQQTTFSSPQNNRSWNPKQRKPNTQDRKTPCFDPIPMTYTELLPTLIQNSLVVPVPLKSVEPPYPKGYDQNAKCDYHAGAVGHSTENCQGLKYKVQRLIDAKWLNFKENEPNYGGSAISS